MHLICKFIQSTEEPSFVFWYHEDAMISFDQYRGINTGKNKTGSTLSISSINHSHSGNYSCVPSNTRPASILVHILDGKPLHCGIVIQKSKNLSLSYQIKTYSTTFWKWFFRIFFTKHNIKIHFFFRILKNYLKFKKLSTKNYIFLLLMQSVMLKELKCTFKKLKKRGPKDYCYKNILRSFLSILDRTRSESWCFLQVYFFYKDEKCFSSSHYFSYNHFAKINKQKREK